MIGRGVSPSSAARYLATLRSVLGYAIADGRIYVNVAATVKPPGGRSERREGQFLTVPQLYELHEACKDRYADLALVLGFAGLRWGELAGLQVGDLISVPGRGLRLQRAVLKSGEGGMLFIDSLKSKRARTVPLVDDVVPIVDRWAQGKDPDDFLFSAPHGGPLSETNWKRMVDWTTATEECLDGRDVSCVPYSDWVTAWSELRS